MKKKSSAPVVLVTLLLLAMLGTLAFTNSNFSFKKLNLFKNRKPLTTDKPLFPLTSPTPMVRTVIVDKPINPAELEITTDGRFEYHFTLGEPHQAEADYKNNYTVQFPTSWQAFTNTNEKSRDDYGTNLILKKEGSTITIDQQLYEAMGCIFTQEGRPIYDVGIPCKLVENLTIDGKPYKIFQHLDRVERYGEKRYGLCKVGKNDQCSPWAEFGEVQYVTTTDSEIDYQEFISIAKSTVVD